MPEERPSTEGPPSPAEAARIADVERATGVPRATLRIWERRYGFPNPRRDRRGERYYLEEDIDRLRLVGQLVARGQRPGTLLRLPSDTLRAMLEAPAAPRFADEPLVRLLCGHDPAALHTYLLQQLALVGLDRFVCERLAGANVVVGDAWAAGELQVHEEHLYTATVDQVVRSAMAALPPVPAGGRPRVLLGTLPHELHGLGLLMAEAVLRQLGCPCVSLGVNVPLDQLAAAAVAYRADVLALSLSAGTRSREAAAQLRDLRRRLPDVHLWVGGSGSALALEPALRIRRFGRIDELRDAAAGLRSGAGA